MKERNYKMYIEDILNSILKIEKYVKEYDYVSFVEDQMLIDAVLRNLEIIGEASKNIPTSVKNKHEENPWSKMISLRNIMIHEYFGVDLSIIWQIITKNLAEAKPLIEKMLETL